MQYSAVFRIPSKVINISVLLQLSWNLDAYIPNNFQMMRESCINTKNAEN